MAAKKSFPLRINPDVLAATQRWADDELRSVNAQIEYVLRDALIKSGRIKLVQQVVTEIEALGTPKSEELKADKRDDNK
ncbi:hypothetical protein DXX93_13790 [Thalassotalea euphylliae]|uniref:Arc family DNA binding domain-containing protein n=1 Tax=Thalassotalea euphylliae TaxID=1655234 RepID=A0A3E0TSX5_9GAMM|nr:hypothetical protein [Thalassotalea euphylliae]REL27524.1 hypothetical protein DXX93_13790 [Thalassotalea euphylliae]